MFVFQEIWCTLFSCNTRFEICSCSIMSNSSFLKIDIIKDTFVFAISYACFYNLQNSVRVEDRDILYRSFEINGVGSKLMAKLELLSANLVS